jgi:6,7-dimethyl-8-ribityllumazine synthase
VPIGFGILTTPTLETALERAGTKAGNKGAQAMEALLETIAVYKGIEE